LRLYERAPNEVTATEDVGQSFVRRKTGGGSFCSRLKKLKRQSALRFSFTISRPGSAGRDFISEDYLLAGKIRGKGYGRAY